MIHDIHNGTDCVQVDNPQLKIVPANDVVMHGAAVMRTPESIRLERPMWV